MSKIDDDIKYLNNICSRLFPSAQYGEMRHQVDIHMSDEDTVWRADALTKSFDDMAEKYPMLKKSDPEGQVHCQLYEWIGNKVLYSFDEDVEASFADMHWKDLEKQPVELLSTLPLQSFGISFNRSISLGHHNYDCCIIYNDYLLENPRKSSGLFFLFGNTAQEGRYHRVLPKGLSIPMVDKIESNTTREADVIVNDEYLTIKDAYIANCKDNQDLSSSEARVEYKRMLIFILPYLLYLCSQNAEVSQTSQNKRIYRPNTDQPKHKYREVKQLVCGVETGARIRNFKKLQQERRESGTGSVKTPHVRRAHYHRYWVGRGANKHIEIKWLPETYIHADLKDFIKPTGAKIKKSYT